MYSTYIYICIYHIQNVNLRGMLCCQTWISNLEALIRIYRVLKKIVIFLKLFANKNEGIDYFTNIFFEKFACGKKKTLEKKGGVEIMIEL